MITRNGLVEPCASRKKEALTFELVEDTVVFVQGAQLGSEILVNLEIKKIMKITMSIERI